MSFYTAGVEKVRINAGGSIGIGTDDPQQDVHILRSQLSRVRIESTSTAYNSDVIFQNPDGLLGVVGYNATLDSINIDSRGGTNGVTFTRTGVEKVRIASDGKVGIGTNSPDFPLHVFHPTSNNIALFESGDAFASMGLSDSNGSVAFVTTLGKLTIKTNGDAGTVGTNSDTAMVIEGGGDVGIGTDNPAVKLDVR